MTGSKDSTSGRRPGFLLWTVPPLALTALLVAILVLRRGSFKEKTPSESSGENRGPTRTWVENFDQSSLDPATWSEVSKEDFKERTVDIVDSRLRLRCGTVGTDDRTVKSLGVRRKGPLDLKQETWVSAELDWNDQANGSYLSAGIVLTPTETSGNPLEAPDWLKVEYVGVPPGRNARMVVAAQSGGMLRLLFTEGWPQENREGRKIGLQKVRVDIKEGAVKVWENGKLMYDSGDRRLFFESAHLYLHMSSHSNYPPREVFFDRIEVARSQ